MAGNLLSCLARNAHMTMQKFDEMFAQLPGNGPVQFQGQSMGGMSQVQVQGVRDHYRTYADWLGRQSQDMLRSRREEAEMIFRRVGITFAVYGAKAVSYTHLTLPTILLV